MARGLQDVARTTRFITGAELAVAGDPLEIPLQLWQLGRQALEARHPLGASRQDGDRDRVLVDIEAEIDRRGSSSSSS